VSRVEVVEEEVEVEVEVGGGEKKTGRKKQTQRLFFTQGKALFMSPFL